MTKMMIPILTTFMLGVGFGKVPLPDIGEYDDYSSVYGTKNPLTYSSDLYGPFKSFPASAPSLNLYITRKSNHSDFDSICIHFNLYSLRNNKIALTRYIEHQTFDSSKKMTVPLAFNLGQNFAPEGIKVELEIYSEIRDYYKKEFSFNLYPCDSKETINAKDYSLKTLKLRDTALEIKNNSVVTYQETYTFSEYYDYFLLDHYYHLRLTQFTFQYAYPKDFSYANATMIIKEAPDCFNKLKKNNLNDVSIPLQAYLTEENKIGLKFTNHLFVNKNTLEMSFFPDNENYVATNTFFLPKNGAEEVDGTKFQFKIESCGYGDITLLWEVTFDSTRYLIGNCADSDYCVIEGVVD